MALGYTKPLTEDRYMWSRSKINDDLATLMGGRAAEEIIFNEATTGAQNDIKQATDWARRMVTDFGMSDKLGPQTFGDKQEMVFLGREISEQKDYGDKVADLIDDEVHKIIQRAYEVAMKVLTENKSKLTRLAETLIAQETLEGEELDALLDGTPRKPVSKPKATSARVPVRATAKPESASKRAPTIPRPLPKQAPATPD